MTTETTMPEDDIRLIADLADLPFEKVRTIVWLAEKHQREAHRHAPPTLPLGPIGWEAIDRRRATPVEPDDPLAPPPDRVVDLMAALEESVAAAKAARTKESRS